MMKNMPSVVIKMLNDIRFIKLIFKSNLIIYFKIYNLISQYKIKIY